MHDGALLPRWGGFRHGHVPLSEFRRSLSGRHDSGRQEPVLPGQEKRLVRRVHDPQDPIPWGDGGGDKGSEVTFPTPDRCIPDDPNPDIACPLLPGPPGPSDYPTLTGSELCTKACREYAQCTRDEDVQVGFVCDAALCTSECDDLGLVGQACSGLNPTKCQINSIIAVEEIAECSCCASQICACEPNTATNQEIYRHVI